MLKLLPVGPHHAQKQTWGQPFCQASSHTAEKAYRALALIQCSYNPNPDMTDPVCSHKSLASFKFSSPADTSKSESQRTDFLFPTGGFCFPVRKLCFHVQLWLATGTCCEGGKLPFALQVLARGPSAQHLLCPPGTFFSLLPSSSGNSVKHCHNFNSYLHFINNDNIYFNAVKSE